VSTGNYKSIARSSAWQGMGQLFERAYSTRGYGDFVHYHLLARGALEVVIESDISILDFAALTVIIREAGGTLTDLEGEPTCRLPPRAH
jgi:histidinol-phosphatase